MELNNSLSNKAQQDIELVNRAQDGDQKAYAQLLGKYRDAIYFMLLKMVKNPVDADDLTIEAFGKAFKNIKQYTPIFAFSTWLFRIASNNAIDFIRRKRGSTISLDQSIEGEESLTPSSMIHSDTLDPESNMINDQKIKMMHDVVTKLKPRYRSLIELRYFKEYSYEEISEYLDLPIGTVKAQLFRARDLLFNILKTTEKN
ncbi:MAG: sigma-70 family RNA polymerase sigma factor [Bacteroidales bacterium]|nr:sigma-70 family RNA polymerase sigma factor [Bacteroidales bacterium]